MRSSILILVSGILLFYPNHLFAISQEAKAKILIDEWSEALKPKVDVSQEKLTQNPSEFEDKEAICKPKLPQVFDKKITLRASGVNLNTILNKMAQVTGCNVVYDPEVDSNILISVDAQDVSVWRALNTVLFPLSYGFKVKDNDLVILSKETMTFKLNLPPSTQTFSDTVSNESWTRPDALTTSGVNNNNSNMNIKIGARVFVETKEESVSFWRDIETNLSRMISPKGKYSFNKVAGLVMVTDNPQALDKISRYINLVNRETGKQILAEVKILEVTLSNEFSYGIDWSTIYKKLGSIKSLSLSSNFGAQNLISPSFFTLTAQGPNEDSGTYSSGIAALIKALQAQGKVEVISQPKIMLLNNQSAVVQVGTVTSFVANTTTTTTQAGLATTSATTDQVQEGVTLRLMASILNDEILVQLTPVVTTLDKLRSINMGQGVTIEAPKTSTKSMHTLVKIKDGETIAVGGLITSNNNKSEEGIPILRKLPLIGGLFEYKSKSSMRTELVIFITPKILQK